MRIVGYGIAGGGEADRYMEATLKEFDRLCDETIILGNNITDKERELVQRYGFSLIEDNRTWGKNQHKIKEDFVRNHVAKLNPDLTVCLDMDEVFVNVEREDLEKLDTRDAYYVFIVNLWGRGYRSDWSFWNVRVWGWHRDIKEFFTFHNQPLHCGLAPKWTYFVNKHAPFVLEHYGLKTKASRSRKIKRYEEFDPKQQYREPGYYEALKRDEYEPYDRDKIVEMAEKHVASLKQPNGKTLPFQTSVEMSLIEREADGMIIEVPKGKEGFYLKQKYKGQGFKIV